MSARTTFLEEYYAGKHKGFLSEQYFFYAGDTGATEEEEELSHAQIEEIDPNIWNKIGRCQGLLPYKVFRRKVIDGESYSFCWLTPERFVAPAERMMASLRESLKEHKGSD